MSDLQLLFLVLAALYGWECACWLPRGAVAFTTWLGRCWRVAHPGALLGNQRAGFIFAAPLPPLGTLLTANQFPLSLSPQGVLAFVSTTANPGWRPAQTGRFARWEDVRTVRAQARKLVVNGEVWWTAPSPILARRWADELARLAKLAPGVRGQAVNEAAEAGFDEKAAGKRWHEFLAQARALRGLGNALVVYVFAAAPAVIWHLGLRLSWLGLLAGLLALMIACATLFRRAHRILFPEATDERFTHTLTIALSPANAMRAHDALSRPLLEGFHPLAVAKLLLPPAGFREFARRTLLDLRHPALPRCPSHDPVSCETEAFWRTTVRDAAERLLRREGIQPDDLCCPPKPADAQCRAYCPRCQAQFTTLAGECADCGGLALVALEIKAG